jgi:hypothetical protein
VRIWSNPCRHSRATTLPSSHHTGDSCADTSLGGVSAAYTVAVGGVLGATAPLDAVPTVVEDRPSRLPNSLFPCSIFTVVTSQNEFLSSPRSRRKKPCVVSCTVARSWLTQATSNGTFRCSVSVGLDWERRRACRRPRVNRRLRLEREIPLRFIKSKPQIARWTVLV